MKQIKTYLCVFLKGMGMGSADIIPGVSGGTIALLTGIYEKLLTAIQSWNTTALTLLRTGKFKALWQHVQGPFLLPLVAGIGVSMLTTVHLVTYLLAQYPIQSWSFLGGLVLASAWTVYQQIKQWKCLTLLFSVGGIVLAYGMTQAMPMHTPDTPWLMGLSGAIAACAMLLPGISGSFLLLLLGKYECMLHALKALKLDLLFPFSLGGVIGLLSFVRLIAWLLRHHHDHTLAFLAGLMLGSLNKLWPWKQPIDLPGVAASSIAQNMAPLQYPQDPLVLQAVLWMSLGMLLVVGMEKIAQIKQQSA